MGFDLGQMALHSAKHWPMGIVKLLRCPLITLICLSLLKQTFINRRIPQRGRSFTKLTQSSSLCAPKPDDWSIVSGACLGLWSLSSFFSGHGNDGSVCPPKRMIWSWRCTVCTAVTRSHGLLASSSSGIELLKGADGRESSMRMVSCGQHEFKHIEWFPFAPETSPLTQHCVIEGVFPTLPTNKP